MRAVFLFFLLVNAAFFYMKSDLFKEDMGPVILKKQPLPDGVERLTLLREKGLGAASSSDTSEKANIKTPENIETLGDTTNPGGTVEAEPVAGNATTNDIPEPEQPKPVEMACFTLGPFAQASTAGRTAETISALGVTVNRRQTTQRRPRGYWVYLPAFKTYAAARKRVAELQDKGLNDMFIMGKGDHKNAVSLGLFKSRSAAEERFEQVKKMGLSVNIETQYRVTQLAWLDMEIPEDQISTISAISEIAQQMPKTTLTQRRCK